MVLMRLIFDHLRARVNPQSDVGMALLNYIQAFQHSEEVWRPKIISDFFLECLIYPHWQQNRKLLRNETQKLLAEVQHESRMDLQLEHIQWVTEYQVIEIMNSADWHELILNYLKSHQIKDSQVKIRLCQDSQFIYGLILNTQTGQLEVRIYDNRFTIQKGALVPLRETYKLVYDAQLNLLEGQPFFIELGPFIRGRFQIRGGLYDYSATRGFLFQRFQAITRSPVESIPRLFYPLKRIESLFLKKDSNPFYIGLVQELERMVHQLRLREPLSSKDTMDLLVRAKNSLEYVFHDDKLLTLLIKELEEKASVQDVSWSLPKHEFIDAKSRGTEPWLEPMENKRYDLTDL
jgi:hypothetical protein